MARRDIAKHRGRSLLVALLVGLPVLLICAGATALATHDVNASEGLPRMMGRSQALISPVRLDGVEHQRVRQDPDPNRGGYYTDGKARRGPGVSADAPWTAQRLQRLTGGTVLPAGAAAVPVKLGDRHLNAMTLFVDGRRPATRGMTSLDSGRWPRSADEVVVTAEGVADGLPRHGHVTITPAGADPVEVTVVGVGHAWVTDTTTGDLVALPSAATAWHSDLDSDGFLVADRGPITWAQVKRLNTYGLIVTSRQVISHPQQAQADPSLDAPDDDGALAAVVALIVVGILVETVLLAGPAFAVSAARQRRSLALIASNGARPVQVRRYVLAQAVLLGAVSAVAGAVVGVPVGVLAIRWWASAFASNPPGPVDIPGWEVLGMVACAAVASLVAAYLPARGAGRLDLVAVLRGHGVTARRVRRGQPVLGLILAGAGGVALVVSVVRHGHETGITVGALVLVCGGLLLIPWLLSAAGRLGRALPLPLRMATRDIGRQRGRSGPAVAAIMTAVTALTALTIANAGDQAQAARDHEPSTVMGQGLLTGAGAGWPADAVATVHRAAPGLEIMPVRRIGANDRIGADGAGPPVPAKSHRKTTIVRVQRASCARRSGSAHRGGVDAFGPVRRCSALGSDRYSSRSSIGVVDAAAARKRLGLSPAQIDVLTHGGILIAASRHVVHSGNVMVLTGVRKLTEYGEPVGRIRAPHTQQLPTAAVSAKQLDRFGRAGSTGALITPATAAAQHWETYTDALSLREPDGAIPEDTEEAISRQLSDREHLEVERGYESDLLLIYLVLFGIFGSLVLVATLVSTALAQAEGRADLATLAAVGATRRVRRMIAGSQAFVVGLIGSLLGLAIGFVPGVALTWPLTAQGPGAEPVIDIPWAALAVVGIGVPLLAAVMAALAIWTSPQVTRRLA